jgi:hypothetical protein
MSTRFLGLRLATWPILLFLIACCSPAPQKPRMLGADHLFKPTSKPVISSPIAHDFDGDGIMEIAVGSWDGSFYLLDAQLNDIAGWPKHSPRGFFSSPTLGDLDGDNRPEIIAGSEAGKLFAWRADGRNAPGFPVDLGYKIWASATVLEGPLDCAACGLSIAIGSNEEMLVLDARGQPLDGWPQPMHGWPDATAAWTPGLLTVTTLTPGDPSQGWLYAWRQDGTLLPGFPLELPMDSDSSPALADFDGDGQWWIVFGDDAGWLHVVNTNGAERPGFPVRTTGPPPGPTPTPHPPGGNVYSLESSPAIADLNGDGRLEIAIGSWDTRMYLWDDTGNPLPGWPVAATDQIISSAALVNLDEDDKLEIVVGSKDGLLYGWTVGGQSLPGFPYDLGAPVFSSPWVGDLEGDGQAEIVVGANNGIHLIEDAGQMGARTWPTFHQNNERTGAGP